MTRIDIVGLSLAEIALVLLFCFVAVFAPAYARLDRKLQVASAQPNEAAELKKKLAATEAENHALKHELEGYRRNLRSKATPSCTEISKASGPLFTAIIQGEDRYEVNGESFSLASLTQHYSDALADAKKNGCVHSIRVYYGNGVSVSDYDYALRRIEQVFYDTKLGSENTR
jgi:hypothetical protein